MVGLRSPKPPTKVRFLSPLPILYNDAVKPLEGKVVIITGASAGIGEASAREFARSGAIVVLAARREARLKALAEEIELGGGKALAVKTDLLDINQITNLVEQTIKTFGKIDTLFNCAGWGRYKWFENFSHDEIRKQYEVNVIGLAEVTRQVLPYMQKQRSGHIINMSSQASRISAPPLTVYASTKYAVEGLTDGLRREVAPWGIKVSRVHPGGVTGTEFNIHAAENGGISYKGLPMGRVSREKVAKEIVKLAINPKSELLFGSIYRPLVFISRQFPGIVDFIMNQWVKLVRRNELKSNWK